MSSSCDNQHSSNLTEGEASAASTSSNQKRKVALITGITGQDGSYLAEFLLQKGYQVHGMVRRASTFNTGRITHLCENPDAYQGNKLVKLHYGDLGDGSSLVRVLQTVKPDEIYNLGAQSHLKVSFDMCVYTGDVDGIGVLRLLEAIRTCDMTKTVRLYQASSSELYGKLTEIPQRETTPFCPRTPYGVAKLYAYWIVVNYREAYDMFAVNGIMFNHESPRRGETFVTRKITRSVAKIHLGLQEELELGNLNATRDWGHALDYIEAMWLMLQVDQPEDYVISTGEGHTVREFVEAAFKIVGTEIQWEGSAENELGRDKKTGRVLVRVNPLYYRPTEIEYPLGDCTKAKTKLGWQPRYTFDALVKEMVEFDLSQLKENQKA